MGQIGRKLLTLAYIAIFLSMIIYGASKTISSFTVATPLNISFYERTNHTLFLDIPEYAHITNITFRIRHINSTISNASQFDDSDIWGLKPVAIWHFNQSLSDNSTINDTSGNQLNLSIGDDRFFCLNGSQSIERFNHSGVFSGHTCLKLGGYPPKIDYNYSVFAWAKPTNFSIGTLLDLQRENQEGGVIYTHYPYLNHLYLQIKDTANNVDCLLTYNATTLNDGGWHNIGYGINGTDCWLAYDGNFVNKSGGMTDSIYMGYGQQDNSWMVGCAEGNANYYVGYVDDIIILNISANKSILDNIYQHYPFNLTIDIGSDSSLEYNKIINQTTEGEIDSQKGNQKLMDICTCAGCSKTEGYCRMPIVFYSYVNSTVEIDITNLTYSYGIDNCSNYNASFINYTFYRSSNDPTTADSRINLSCNFITDQYNFTELTYNRRSNKYCFLTNYTNVSCTGIIYYMGNWTDDWIYDYYLTATDMNDTDLYLNLTVPKLYLDFSTTTDITVITSDTVYYFKDSSTLLAMTNLSIGKVSVIFNNGTQFYEYYNDQNTYIDEELKVISGQDDWVNIRVQDETFGILDEATVEIYELNMDNNQTTLVSTLYGNNEKTIELRGNDKYLAKAYYSGYDQQGEFKWFIPAETEGNNVIITMSENRSSQRYEAQINYGTPLTFTGSVTSYALEVTAEAQERADFCIYWYINNSNLESICETSTFSIEKERVFFEGDGEHEIYVYADGEEIERFIIKEAEIEQHYEESYYTAIRTSKLAFAILFILSAALAVSVHKRFRNYGIHTICIFSILTSFLNYYMLIIAIPTALGLIAKRTAGDDQ